ncbi:MAG: cysteine synthase [Acidobacteriota bacterium]|nr:cysteine synthase [Acidobacteriota bacterium]
MSPQVTVEAINKTPARFREVKHMIGNTPLIAIDFNFRSCPRTLYAKAEHLNMTGSIKDRMAFHILKRAYQTGLIQPGATIAEATSGNTGISFAAIGRALGHDVSIYMPDWMSPERAALIKSLGATVIPVSRAEGGFTGSIRLTEELAASDPSVFLPRFSCRSRWARTRSSSLSSPTTTRSTSAQTCSEKRWYETTTSRPRWRCEATAPSSAPATPASSLNKSGARLGACRRRVSDSTVRAAVKAKAGEISISPPFALLHFNPPAVVSRPAAARLHFG